MNTWTKIQQLPIRKGRIDNIINVNGQFMMKQTITFIKLADINVITDDSLNPIATGNFSIFLYRVMQLFIFLLIIFIKIKE